MKQSLCTARRDRLSERREGDQLSGETGTCWIPEPLALGSQGTSQLSMGSSYPAHLGILPPLPRDSYSHYGFQSSLKGEALKQKEHTPSYGTSPAQSGECLGNELPFLLSQAPLPTTWGVSFKFKCTELSITSLQVC